MSTSAKASLVAGIFIPATFLYAWIEPSVPRPWNQALFAILLVCLSLAARRFAPRPIPAPLLADPLRLTMIAVGFVVVVLGVIMVLLTFPPPSSLYFSLGVVVAGWVGWFCLDRPLAARQVREERRAAGQCPACGYNLTANISGVCPECGATAVPR